jgi:AcrR family transcriptional regulator
LGVKRLSRDESREVTRHRLLTAAAELFAERGVTGASVEQIAERAGYSRGAFYGNFEDKKELVVALLEQRTRQELTEVRALAKGTKVFADVLEPLRKWHRQRGKHLTGWLLLRIELWLYGLRNPDILPELGKRERFARAAITEAIERDFTARDIPPPADPAFLALIVHALEDGLLIQRRLTQEEGDDGVIVEAIDLLMRSWTALGAQERNV